MVCSSGNRLATKSSIRGINLFAKSIIVNISRLKTINRVKKFIFVVRTSCPRSQRSHFQVDGFRSTVSASFVYEYLQILKEKSYPRAQFYSSFPLILLLFSFCFDRYQLRQMRFYLCILFCTLLFSFFEGGKDDSSFFIFFYDFEKDFYATEYKNSYLYFTK